MLRSIVAVIAGYMAMAIPIMVIFLAVLMVLVGGMPDPSQPPPAVPLGINVALIAFSSLFAVFGGYVAAWIGKHAPLKHALALGILMLALGGMMMVMDPDNPEPLGSRIATLALALPCPILGGWLRARRQAGQS